MCHTFSRPHVTKLMGFCCSIRPRRRLWAPYRHNADINNNNNDQEPHNLSFPRSFTTLPVTNQPPRARYSSKYNPKLCLSTYKPGISPLVSLLNTRQMPFWVPHLLAHTNHPYPFIFPPIGREIAHLLHLEQTIENFQLIPPRQDVKIG